MSFSFSFNCLFAGNLNARTSKEKQKDKNHNNSKKQVVSMDTNTSNKVGIYVQRLKYEKKRCKRIIISS